MDPGFAQFYCVSVLIVLLFADMYALDIVGRPLKSLIRVSVNHAR